MSYQEFSLPPGDHSRGETYWRAAGTVTEIATQYAGDDNQSLDREQVALDLVRLYVSWVCEVRSSELPQREMEAQETALSEAQTNGDLAPIARLINKEAQSFLSHPIADEDYDQVGVVAEGMKKLASFFLKD